MLTVLVEAGEADKANGRAAWTLVTDAQKEERTKFAAERQAARESADSLRDQLMRLGLTKAADARG